MFLSSVIIPWHRHLADLRNAVASVIDRGDPAFEVVVVANGVGDQDFEAASALCGDPRCRIERMRAAGAAASRNPGIRCPGAFATAALTGSVPHGHAGTVVLRGPLPRRMSRRLVNLYFQRRAASEL